MTEMSAFCTGSIDEVSKQVNMTWVQPRVLDLTQVSIGRKYIQLKLVPFELVQIKDMAGRLSEWCRSVKETIHAVEDQVPELLA
jgi:hypothetical protein